MLLYNTFWKYICIPINPEGNYNVMMWCFDVLMWCFSNDEIFSPAENLLNCVLSLRLFTILFHNGNSFRSLIYI